MDKVICVRVIPRAKRDSVLETASGLKVHLMAPPEDGKANNALVEVLASHFGVKRSQISIIKGARSRDKVINIKKECP
jgi:uncharacterized protein (TIGR00251 family)